jgi:hypothetical protein
MWIYTSTPPYAFMAYSLSTGTTLPFTILHQLLSFRTKNKLPVFLFTIHLFKRLFNSPNPSSRNITLESTQPIREMSIRNLPGGKGRPARKADLTAICEPTV